MIVDSGNVRGPLGMVLALGLCFGTGCQGDEGGDDVGTPDDGADTSPPAGTTGDPPDDPTTSGAADGMTADGADAADGASTGTEEEVDPRLDRSAPNILDDPDLCGYPGPGEYGYGGLIDQNRFPNFVLEDCDGNQREFAEFFCRRDDIEDFNKVFILVMEAVW